MGSDLRWYRAHERDALHLVVVEAGEPVGAADHVVAVLVVLGVGQEHPDVAQQRRRFEDLPGVVAEPVSLARRVEELESEARDLGRVRRVLVHQLTEVEDALTPEIGQVVERAAVTAPPRVEQHALAERVVGHDQLGDVELVHHLLEDHGTGEDDVGPAGVEPGELGSGLGVGGCDQLLHQGVELLGGEHEVADRAGPCAGGAQRRHLGQVGDRARGADRHLHVVLADLARERGDRGAHEPPAGIERPGVREVAVEEPAGEADGAELQRSRCQHLASMPHEQLGAAAADVAQQQALLEHRHGLQHAEVDEPRLLHPGDDVHEHTGLVPGPVDEQRRGSPPRARPTWPPR